MTEPEIARRCHACGASIRDHAVFCPQCGKKLKTTAGLGSQGQDQNPSTAVDTAPLQETPKQKTPVQAERSASNPGKRSGAEPAKREELKSQQSQPKEPLGQQQGTPDQAGRAKQTPGKKHGGHVLAEARGKVQRATGIARNVGGDVVQRGQKLREMSSVVLDEAAYDPSLRFVLVAAALFILFLVMVLLNRFIV